MIDDSMIGGLSGINQEAPLAPFCAFQNHSIGGYILKWSDARTGLELFRASLGGCDEVYYPHPPDHLAKYCVTRPARRPVEPEVASLIDKKLGGGGMRIHCSGNRYGTAIVGEAVVRLVFDWVGGRFLSHVGVETASLNHEVVDDPMKDGAVVEAVVNVRQKVFYCLWRFFPVQFKCY